MERARKPLLVQEGIKHGKLLEHFFHVPLLARPYFFPASIAFWAFESFVDAIIFIDCTTTMSDCSYFSEETVVRRTFVIFSMFLTDLRRSSISRSVAIFLAPQAVGWATARTSERQASIVDIGLYIESGQRNVGHARLSELLTISWCGVTISARMPLILYFSSPWTLSFDGPVPAGSTTEGTNLVYWGLDYNI